MKEYYITFESFEDNEIHVATGHGNTGQDAVRELMNFAQVLKIIKVIQAN